MLGDRNSNGPGRHNLLHDHVTAPAMANLLESVRAEYFTNLRTRENTQLRHAPLRTGSQKHFDALGAESPHPALPPKTFRPPLSDSGELLRPYRPDLRYPVLDRETQILRLPRE